MYEYLRAIRTPGRVVHRDGDIATLDASLHDDDDRPLARATATARVIPLIAAAAAP